jgi:hypothetical protein
MGKNVPVPHSLCNGGEDSSAKKYQNWDTLQPLRSQLIYISQRESLRRSRARREIPRFRRVCW